MSEYFDLLDEKGDKTGKTKLRSEVHRDGDWHKSTHVWITNSKNQVLIQKRSAQKDSHPNFWDISVAGHVPAGTDPLESATREIKEELGIDIEMGELVHLFTYKQSFTTNDNSFVNNQFNEVYLLKNDIDLNKVSLQESEVSEVKFISLDEFKNLTQGDEMVPHQEEYQRLISILEKKFNE